MVTLSRCVIIQKKYGIPNEYWKIVAQGKVIRIKIQSIFIANANSEVKHKFTSRVKSWKCKERSTPGSIYPKRRAQPVKKPRTICRANIQTHN